MPSFSYKALSNNGTVATGEIEAADRPEALRVLDKRGLQPVNLKESSKADPAKSLKKKETNLPKRRDRELEKTQALPDGPLKLKRAEVILFTEELSDMLGAGLQLEPALRSMENRYQIKAN